MQLDPQRLPSPCYVLDIEALERNLLILNKVQKKSGCKILLALKGFAMFSVFPMIRRYLNGTAASSLNEARLGREEFGNEVHVYSPAYRDDEFNGIIEYADHITFNSFSQWQRFKKEVTRTSEPPACALRINPEHSEVDVKLYDPCAEFSRLGITLSNFQSDLLDGISGLHFHTLCELNSDSLDRTLAVVEQKFGSWFDLVQWINFGGGHHITRQDYDLDLLCELIGHVRNTHGLEVYLEPSEAIALNAGFLVATVLDIVDNGIPIAVLDTSAAAHMPDVLEMPYRPQVIDAADPGEHAFTYRLAGSTCLAGDVIGDYSFDKPLETGSRLVFTDMAHYTMVKNTTFNGIQLPAIATFDPRTGEYEVIREFGYGDYRNRLS